MPAVHILVGCGGSGLKSLRKANKLFCQDYYWRRRMDEEIYYVAVDTDQKDLRKFQEEIDRDLRSVPRRPHVLPIHLSKDVTSLQSIVEPVMVHPFTSGQRDIDGQNRLLEHWWHTPKEDGSVVESVFTAPNVVPVTLGAGQCPPVSYFLAWRQLPELAKQFDRLADEISMRLEGNDEVDFVNMLIVSGLAGGTGRGCWELIAFKLREMLASRGRVVDPRVILFDSSCFQAVYDQRPEQRVAMQANSLTGLSQLSCWVRNQEIARVDRAGAIQYRLPSLSRPDVEASDVLKIDLDRDINEASPVNHAFLIFRDNSSTVLLDPERYYEMVGAGLYGALSKSEIEQQEINSAFPLCSMAVATCEVNASEIRTYFEARARERAVADLTKKDDARTREALDSFLDSTGIKFEVDDYSPRQEGNLLQRMLATLLDDYNDKVEGLKASLRDDDADKAMRMFRKCLPASESDANAVGKECLKKVMAGSSNPLKVLAEAVDDLFRETNSVKCAATLLEEIEQTLKNVVKQLEQEESQSDPKAVRQLYEGKVKERSRKTYLLFGKRFTEAETEELSRTAINCIRNVFKHGIVTTIHALYDQLIEHISQIRKHIAVVLDSVEEVRAKLAYQTKHSVPDSDDSFSTLFCDPAHPELALDERYSAVRFFRRMLRPPLTPEQAEEMLGSSIQVDPELWSECHRILGSWNDRNWKPGGPPMSATEEFAFRKKTIADIESIVAEGVALHDHFMVQNFSLRKVAEQLYTAWVYRLDKQSLNEARRSDLEEQFREQFGVTLRREISSASTTYEHIDFEDFIVQIGAALASNCKPYWVLKGTEPKQTRVMLFLPTSKIKEAAEEMIRQHLAARPVHVAVYREPLAPDVWADKPVNPFVAMAYATAGVDSMDEIGSAHYYDDDANLRQLMEDVEDPSGETIHRPRPEARNAGMGYADPMYVKQDEFRAKRWKPWVEERERARQERERVIDALLYALFPGDATDGGKLVELAGKLAAIQWPMPLFEEKRGQWYSFSRLPLSFEDRKGVADQSTQSLDGWDPGKSVASSAGLPNLKAALQKNRAWVDRILEESRMFRAQVLPAVNASTDSSLGLEVLREYEAWLGERMRAVADDHPAKPIWKDVTDRVERWWGESL